MSGLTKNDAARLAELESVIRGGLKTFIEVGEALAEIRDARLYRDSHSTFEDYCRERWEFSASRARQLIGATESVTTVTGTGLPAPANERQARELAPLNGDEESVIAAWREALEIAAEEGRKLTTTDVRAAVGEKVQRDNRALERARKRAEAQALYDAQSERPRRWAGNIADADPGTVVWRRPPRDPAAEPEAEAELAAAQAEARRATERVKEAEAAYARTRSDTSMWGLLLSNPGSQLVDERGDTWISPDGERVVYAGRGEPIRKGWWGWGYEAADSDAVMRWAQTLDNEGGEAS